MAVSRAGFKAFRLRQLTGIPLSSICEVACDIAYEILKDNAELREEIIRKYSMRSPERQLEIDLKRGYERVIDD